MKKAIAHTLILAVTIVLAPPASAAAWGIKPLFDLSSPSGGPFPSNHFTKPDATQNTGLRVSLPKPDCAARLSDCEDIDLLNELDGFNVFPRLSIPFSGPIDVNSVSSDTVFLVSLGSTRPGGARPGRIIGIDQVVWDVATATLHARAGELLDQHTRYALVVTRGLRDTMGHRVQASGAFQAFRHGVKPSPWHGVKHGHHDAAALDSYRRALEAALKQAAHVGVRPHDVVVASVFTTRSVSAVLEKIRDHVGASGAAPADFLLGPLARRTVFPLSDVTSLLFTQQVGTLPSFNPPVSLAQRLQFLRLIPGAVGTLAFGKYLSPNYVELEFGPYIKPFGTRSGTPHVLGSNEIYFNLFLPAETSGRRRPDGGWPIAIYGPGSNETKQNAVFNVAARLASHGVATIAINQFARGFGPLSTLRVELASGESVVFLAGGRNIDANGDGTIQSAEITQPLRPRDSLGNIAAHTQTIADLIKLARVIEAGMDVDGDGIRDIDPARIYYVGISAGAQLGITLTAVEPSIRALVANSPGGLVGGDQGRLSPSNRPALATRLDERIPSLSNCDGVTNLGGILVDPPCFDENLPLRGEPPVINEVAGAMEIQAVFETRQWLQAVKEPFTFAPYLRKAPLAGRPAKPVLIQFARGDQDLSNPVASAMIRSGALEDRATFYRNDLAFAADPTIRKDPHSFLVRTDQPPTSSNFAIAVAAQEQAAIFLATDGAETIDPDGPCLATGQGCLFEVPIVLPLPEDLGFIP